MQVLQKYGSLIFPNLEAGINFMREIANQRAAPSSIRYVLRNSVGFFGWKIRLFMLKNRALFVRKIANQRAAPFVMQCVLRYCVEFFRWNVGLFSLRTKHFLCAKSRVPSSIRCVYTNSVGDFRWNVGLFMPKNRALSVPEIVHPRAAPSSIR